MIIMSTKERAYEIIDNLSEEQLNAFIVLFRSIVEKPNEETKAAMLEADRIAHDPDVKSYYDVDEMFRDILSE